tara:strand:+ start:590 stop:709 length:120 start_codon:yes stop_codon:yes gene_type:complete
MKKYAKKKGTVRITTESAMDFREDAEGFSIVFIALGEIP